MTPTYIDNKGWEWYADSYNSKTGVKTQRIDTYTFTGADIENWTLAQSTTDPNLYIATSDKLSALIEPSSKCMCDYARYVDSAPNLGISKVTIDVNGNVIFGTSYTTLADWKTYLSAHNHILNYALLNPVSIQYNVVNFLAPTSSRMCIANDHIPTATSEVRILTNGK